MSSWLTATLMLTPITIGRWVNEYELEYNRSLYVVVLVPFNPPLSNGDFKRQASLATATELMLQAGSNLSKIAD